MILPTKLIGCHGNLFFRILVDCCVGCWGCAAAVAAHNFHVAVAAVAVALSGNVDHGIVAGTAASASAVGTEIKTHFNYLPCSSWTVKLIKRYYQ